MLKTAIALLLLSPVLFTACKKKDPLPGIDKKALFATPTAAEIDAVLTDWQTRSLIPQDVTVEETHTINSKLSLQFISFRLYGYKQYAGVLLPTTAKPLPVQVYVYGFSLTEPYSYSNIKASDTANPPFIYVVPALRGQSLTMVVNDVTYKTPVSEGTRNDAFDGATDDAIATLNAVGTVFKEADTSKVMVRGGSRGGTVALLMAERDKRVKLAAGVAFPVELLSRTATHQSDPTYRFQFLEALVNGKATLHETRQLMIASSPHYFFRQLPATQLHFGDKDAITPAEQGQALFDAMKAAGLQDKVELFIYKDRSHSDIGTNNPEMDGRISTFFHQLY